MAAVPPFPIRPDRPSHPAGRRSARPARPDREAIARTAVWGALAFGIAFDATLHGPPGIGWPLAAIVAFAGVEAFGHVRRAAAPFFIAGIAISAFAALRASPILLVIDAAAAISLFCLGAAFAREGLPAVSTVRAYVARTLSIIAVVPEGLAWTAGVVRPSDPNGRLRNLPRTAVIVVPVTAVFAVLLGSADPVFARLLTAPIRVGPGSWPVHAIGVAAGAAAFACLLVRVRRPVAVEAEERPLPTPEGLRGGEWIAMLVAVDAVFAAFVVVQFAYFFGGRTRVLQQQGLTFAEYARSGFWQLLAAAALTGAVIGFAWMAGGGSAIGRHRAIFAWLAGGLVAMTAVVLVSAFRRLSLYEDAFGFTWSRVLGHIAVLVVAALLICGLVAVCVRRASWLPAAAVVVAVVAVIGLNALDPDAFIASRNIDRYRATGTLDTSTLGTLSADAAPVLAAALPLLDPCDRWLVAGLLRDVRDGLASARGWASWSLSRERAADAVAALPQGPPLHAPCV